ncbi:ABC transporter ATP-binding protein [Denitrobaculum tricleocarpae]|uniref:ABC transporter ATP-binding protein n=1 Tax=Denitrobaculum tricleocarpae TaxID=2591009 RepID=A0A545TX54_9PROT|nr:ABC transporter ATP-binding protein [Denitrobaculum tricleocarpae]TQV81809.1 ABC transporter ATP-binding protein [Denitrobaculum tricleocarpae]
MSTGNQALLEVRNLKTRFYTFAGVVNAVDGVSFTVGRGEILGLVGESGGGKSVIGFSILGLIDPPGKVDDGEILFDGVDLRKKSEKEMQDIRGKDIAMVFQDPMTSLNPLQTVGQQIDEMLRLHSELDAKARRARCIEMLTDVGISEAEKRLNNYPHQFSGGMRQRVVIAIAMIAGPQLIIADEPTTALDVTIQSQILKLMKRQVGERHASMILITHDLAVVSQMANEIVVLYCGKIVEKGPKQDLIRNPAHPYTQGLLGSIPKLHGRQERLTQIPGTVPDVRNLPKGCNFRERCPFAQARCAEEEPEQQAVGTNRSVACHFPLEQEAAP